MINDMTVRGLAENTKLSYLRSVIPCRSREPESPPRPFVGDGRGGSTHLRHDQRVQFDQRGAGVRPRPALRR